MKEVKERLEKFKSVTPSKWRVAAASRKENKEWLRYSQSIAMMMLDKMEELGLTQNAVAQKMGCSQQYVSRVLKGTENLSIETIAKIEAALGLHILEPVFVHSVGSGLYSDNF
ncbi:MAG: helix-turn-helix transcriptional regulator [Muribaculaceae bacterium]|nr:helix-turn-helix transcriptional regulator [Muribaculaceae bacterium]